MPGPLNLHRFIRPSEVPGAGKDMIVTVTGEERAELASALDLVSLEKLKAELRLQPRGEGLSVSGRYVCELTYRCVRSLEPFAAVIEEDINRNFIAAQGNDMASEDEIEVGLADEPPDLLSPEGADIGAMLAEALSLALDPYPHKPGTEALPDILQEAKTSPFAALSQLRDKGQ